MSIIAEIAFRLLFPIVVEILLSFVAYLAFNLVSLILFFFRETGDFLVELVTLDHFRDHSKVPVNKKPLHPVPDWAATLLGAFFWCELGVAACLSWPLLSSW